MKKVQILFLVMLISAVSTFGQDYGKTLEFNKGEIFYKNSSDIEIVKQLGDYLVKTGFFDGSPVSVQYLSDNKKNIIKIIVDDSLLTALQYLSQVKYFTHELSENVFNNKNVDIYLTNQYFETKLIIDGFYIGKKLIFGKDEVYFSDGISAQKANEFGTYLKTEGFFSDDGKIVRIYEDLGIFHIAYPILDGYDKNYDYVQLVYAFIKKVSLDFVNNGKVMIHLTDSYLNDLRIICNF
jgi:hypothetical protein